MVVDGCSQGVPNLDWAALPRGEPLFPVAAMYRELLTAFLDTDALARLQARERAGRPDLGGAAPALAADGARRAARRDHLPAREGAREADASPRGTGARVSHRLRAGCATSRRPKELVATLLASASVPPITPVGTVAGEPALDGGLVDNVPVDPLVPFEAQGRRTLVLLTRRYRRLPTVPNRTYVQPSQTIPRQPVRRDEARGDRLRYALGRRDGAAFAESLSSRSSSSVIDPTT